MDGAATMAALRVPGEVPGPSTQRQNAMTSTMKPELLPEAFGTSVDQIEKQVGEALKMGAKVVGIAVPQATIMTMAGPLPLIFSEDTDTVRITVKIGGTYSYFSPEDRP